MGYTIDQVSRRDDEILGLIAEHEQLCSERATANEQLRQLARSSTAVDPELLEQTRKLDQRIREIGLAVIALHVD